MIVEHKNGKHNDWEHCDQKLLKKIAKLTGYFKATESLSKLDDNNKEI